MWLCRDNQTGNRGTRDCTGATEPACSVSVAMSDLSKTPRDLARRVQGFRTAMLSAESVAHPDPNGGFLSGIHIARVFDQLGIGDQMKAKATLMPGREACELLARDGVQLAITQVVEIRAVPGVEVAGVLPPELQNTRDFAFSAGVPTGAPSKATAEEFVRFLRTPDAETVIKAQGMEPG